MYSINVQIRWADIDANRHLRHSAYYDYGASVRMMFLRDNGLTTDKLVEFQIGPVLFREEAVFRREIRLEDVITVDLLLTKATPDFSRWSFRHRFIKEDGTVAAIINIDAAWIDTTRRKLTIPSLFVQEIFQKADRSDDFVMAPLKGSTT